MHSKCAAKEGKQLEKNRRKTVENQKIKEKSN